MSPWPVKEQRTYSSVGWMRSPMVEDVALVLALMAVLGLHPHGPLAVALGAAIPAAIAWSLITLHLPSRVHVDPTGIAFAAYGREHRFAWGEIERIRVRRFIVGDRVLVRIAPSSPLRGRYWLIDSMDGYDQLVRALEERARQTA